MLLTKYWINVKHVHIYLLSVAFAHYYKACSIDASHGLNVSLPSRTSYKTPLRESIKKNFFETKNDLTTVKEMEETAVSCIALKNMHFKEAWANFEEAQRFQRMCRYLKVNYIDYIILNIVTLTLILLRIKNRLLK